MTTYTYHTFVYTYCMCMYLPMIYSKTQRYFSPWSAIPFPTILTLQLRSQFCGSAPASMMEATWFPSYLMLSDGDLFVGPKAGAVGFAHLRSALLRNMLWILWLGVTDVLSTKVQIFAWIQALCTFKATQHVGNCYWLLSSKNSSITWNLIGKLKVNFAPTQQVVSAYHWKMIEKGEVDEEISRPQEP